MRILWKLVKVIVGLAIAIPLLIIVLVTTVGVVGTALALAIVALKLACLALAAYGLFRVGRYILAPAPVTKPVSAPELPAPDPYYQAAMRELDAEMRR
ncbi:MAG TPA: hypothetical protein VK636_02855 [Gemmatimonadaceae bacterium]|nr:hypothetical protein [Gemmatimonadaceae bacterium]